MAALSKSQINQVHLVGRRGPLQAAFTIKELREMLKLPGVETRWRKDDFNGDNSLFFQIYFIINNFYIGVQEQLTKLERPRKRLTELMIKSLSEQKEISSSEGNKKFLPIFLRAPKCVLRNNQMEFFKTELKNNSAIATNEIETFPSDLILRSVGYRSSCVDDTICFDENTGLVPNKQGMHF